MSHSIVTMDPRAGFVAVDMHISVVDDDDDGGWNASRGDPTTKAEIVGIKRAKTGTQRIVVSKLWEQVSRAQRCL
jgi:hypothetical protein